MTRADPNPVGTLIDRRYRVDGLLAKGGMSSVYRGIDTRLGRAVAIKIMDPRFADDRSFVARFEREARLAAQLHHPNVVAVHDQGLETATESTEHGNAFLVMELVDGATLRGLLDKRGPLDVALALSVAEPVLSALAAAHEGGLVHRDVKPENVLIGRHGTQGEGVVKVADFGLVRAVASPGLTSSSVILGTVAYLSPEQVATGVTGAAGDVYSAGIVLFEMLTGRAPYRGDTALSVAYRHVNDDVPAPSTIVPNIPRPLDELVLRATRREQRARPADGGAFLAELRQVRSTLGIGPVPVPVPVPQSTDGSGGSDIEQTAPSLTPVAAPVSTAPVSTASGPGGPHGTWSMGTATQAPVPPPSADEQPTDRPADPQPRTRRRGRWIALWCVVVLLVGGLAGAGLWWFTGGRWIAVPSVVGFDRAGADKTLRDAQLSPAFTERRDNDAPAGTVINSDPAAGEQALAGDSVTVVISTGRPTVPDITAGTSPDEADTAIRDVQLEPRRDAGADEYDADVPAGAVLRVDPQPGTQLNIGAGVTVVLSKGPPPVPVPGVAGQSKDRAFATLRDAGFEPFEAGEEFSAEVPGGDVVRTEPTPGTPIAAQSDKRVAVYVSNAVKMPEVVGKSIPEARQAISDAGLQADVEGNERWGLSLVIDQKPQSGTRLAPGSTVHVRAIP